MTSLLVLSFHICTGHLTYSSPHRHVFIWEVRPDTATSTGAAGYNGFVALDDVRLNVGHCTGELRSFTDCNGHALRLKTTKTLHSARLNLTVFSKQRPPVYSK